MNPTACLRPLTPLFFVCALVAAATGSTAQRTPYVPDEALLKNYDYVYLKDVKTVQFGLVGMPFSYPIIGIDNGAQLELSFDDLSGQVYDYTYAIVHCDADWTPSDLNAMEYMTGFQNEFVTQYAFSRNTLTSYVNYRLQLPNANTRFTKSGNYLLHIYENGDPTLPVLTRRFMVVEPRMQVAAQLARTGDVGQARTHQELDFTVFHEGITINDPYREVTVTVLQNGRWDNAITDLQPQFVRADALVYDYQGKIAFPAGKEFRNLNLQSLRFKGERVARIVEDPVDKFHVQLFSDLDRTYEPYVFFNDLNGQYIIQNADQNVDPHTGADYAWLHFSIVADQSLEDAKVYLFGRFTDWQLLPSYELQYNAQQRIYAGKAFLKQGYYDYAYAVIQGQNIDQPDLSAFDGNWYETENDYQILVYYRPIGTRYDRLVAVGELNTLRR